MARPTRSQKPSQSQLPKRNARRRGRDEENEEDEELNAWQPTQGGGGDAATEDDGDEDMVPDGSQSKNSYGDEIERKAHDLVRLALFHEHRRTPLRREEISKKVLGSNSRSFNQVFERAQRILCDVFGMELVELQSRAEREKEANGKDNNAEGNKALGVKKKSAISGSKTYILRSTLDALIIEYAALTDELILEGEIADAPSDEEDNEDGTVSQCYGSIISWSSSDQLSSIGILYVILALVLVNGRVIADNDLRAVLKQFRLIPNALVPLDNKSTNKTMQMNNYLTLLQKQGFLDRCLVGEPKAGGKRGRVTAATQGGDGNNGEDVNNVEWKWGGRAHSEVGEKAIAKFVAEFMVERMIENENDNGEDDEDEDDDGGGKIKKSGKGRSEGLQEKRLEMMIKGITRAAGGELSDVK